MQYSKFDKKVYRVPPGITNGGLSGNRPSDGRPLIVNRKQTGAKIIEQEPIIRRELDMRLEKTRGEGLFAWKPPQ